MSNLDFWSSLGDAVNAAQKGEYELAEALFVEVKSTYMDDGTSLSQNRMRMLDLFQETFDTSAAPTSTAAGEAGKGSFACHLSETSSNPNLVVYYHNLARLKKEFPGYAEAQDFAFVNLDDIDLSEDLRFPQLSERDNRAVYSEYLGILTMEEHQLPSEMTGLFTFSIPFKSRRFHNNNDMNIRDFNFEDLTSKKWDPSCLYAVSILPSRLPWAQQFDDVLDTYFRENEIDVSEIKYLPYFSSIVMKTSTFFDVQKDLKEFFAWAKDKFNLNIGADALVDNTFGDNTSVRHNVGDYGGLLEKAFGYFCALRYRPNKLRRLGEKLGCANTPFHTECDLSPEWAPEGDYSKIATHCEHLLNQGVLPSDGRDVMLTYTTYGYTSLTDNLISSAEKVGLGHLIIVVCLDWKSLRHYRDMGQPAIYLDGFEASERLDFYEEGWTRLMLAKQVAIWVFLKAKRNVIYIDGDIFIKDNFLNNLRSYSRNHKIAYQSDENRFIEYNGLDPKMIRYCAGFGYIKHSIETINLYEPYLIDLNIYGDDQTYINYLINQMGIEVMQLPCAAYPNGSYWFRNHVNIEDQAQIVHFNWDKPFFDTPKEEIMSHFGMLGDPDQRAEVVRKTPDPIISRLETPLLVNKCVEGWGNKLLSLANTIELAHRHGTKICLDWSEGRYPKYSFSMFLQVELKEAGRWDGKIRIYEDMFDFNDAARGYHPEGWNHERLLGDVYEQTNVKLPESYMHKVLRQEDVQMLQDYCQYDISSIARAGQELEYSAFEKLKFSFKGEANDIRAPLDELFNLDQPGFKARFAQTNVVISDFRYNDTLPHYVRAIQPTGALKLEIQKRSRELPGPICGIHIRLTDFFHSKKFDGNYEALYQRYLEEVRKFDVRNVLICSDSAEPIAWFAKQEGLSTWNVDLERSTDGQALHNGDNKDDFENIRGALLEMGMLSKCDYLIRPRWSSFSAVSQFWGSYPEETVTLID